MTPRAIDLESIILIGSLCFGAFCVAWYAVQCVLVGRGEARLNSENSEPRKHNRSSRARFAAAWRNMLFGPTERSGIVNVDQINLQDWCAKPFDNITRFSINDPFDTVGYRVATDGHAVIALGSLAVTSSNAKGRCLPPNIPDIIKSPSNLTWSTKLPELPNCDHCVEGITEISASVEKCSECNGDGMVEHYCDCEHCDRDKDACESCKETGKVRINAEIKQCNLCTSRFGSVFIAKRYARLIAMLPDVEWAADSECVRLRFPGGVGVVMGVRK